MSTATAEPPPVTVNRLDIPMSEEWNRMMRGEVKRPIWTPAREMEQLAASVSPDVVAFIEERARRNQRHEILVRERNTARENFEAARHHLERVHDALVREEQAHAQVEVAEAGISIPANRMSAANWLACCAPERAQMIDAYAQQDWARRVMDGRVNLFCSVSSDPSDAEPVSGGSERVAGIVGSGDADHAGGATDAELVELVAGCGRD
jgi:hypothetical protein